MLYHFLLDLVGVQVKHIFAGTYANFVTTYQVSINVVSLKSFFPLDFKADLYNLYIFKFLKMLFKNIM